MENKPLQKNQMKGRTVNEKDKKEEKSEVRRRGPSRDKTREKMLFFDTS